MKDVTEFVIRGDDVDEVVLSATTLVSAQKEARGYIKKGWKGVTIKRFTDSDHESDLTGQWDFINGEWIRYE